MSDGTGGGNPPEGGSGGNVTASTYGRLVERGGYATGGFVGEWGPEITWTGGGCVIPAGALAAVPPGPVTITTNPAASDELARALIVAMQDGEIRLWPDDGSAGVPAKV